MNDLRGLQTRYDATQAMCRQQQDLLRKLTPRLQEAAQHLRLQAVSAAQTTTMQGDTSLALQRASVSKKSKKKKH